MLNNPNKKTFISLSSSKTVSFTICYTIFFVYIQKYCYTAKQKKIETRLSKINLKKNELAIYFKVVWMNKI